MDLPLENCPTCKFRNGFHSFAVDKQHPLANLIASRGFGGFGIPPQGRQSWGSWGKSLVDEEEDSQSQSWDSSDESAADEEEVQRQDAFLTKAASQGGLQAYQGLTAGGKAKLEAALLKYFGAFPNGYDVIPTPGDGLLCGFHAVICSMEAMDPDLARPTIEELQVVFKSLGNAEFGLDNDNYFHVDQVGAALYFWGTKYDMNLQVGYIPLGEPPVLVPHPNEDPTTVVFIQHAPGHFSGLRPKKAVHVETVSKIAFRSTKEDSEDSSEDDDMMCD